MYKAYFGVVLQMETAYPAKRGNDSKYKNSQQSLSKLTRFRTERMRKKQEKDG